MEQLVVVAVFTDHEVGVAIVRFLLIEMMDLGFVWQRTPERVLGN
jgi:hypothetical protein